MLATLSRWRSPDRGRSGAPGSRASARSSRSIGQKLATSFASVMSHPAGSIPSWSVCIARPPFPNTRVGVTRVVSNCVRKRRMRSPCIRCCSSALVARRRSSFVREMRTVEGSAPVHAHLPVTPSRVSVDPGIRTGEEEERSTTAWDGRQRSNRSAIVIEPAATAGRRRTRTGARSMSTTSNRFGFPATTRSGT